MPENEMKQIKVAKVTINISEENVGDQVENAYDLIEKLTGREPVRVESSEKAKTFGNRSGLNIAAMITLRGEEAEEFLEKVRPAIQDLDADAFSDGNFAFGISEYIDVPGIDYDADIGMKGFEVNVVLERPGYRVKKRDHKPSGVGDSHKVSNEEAIKFVSDELGFEVTR
ncbi:MAG: 50S ribosomal protein L5 [Candidatus Nanohaloarchaea archaeon]